MSQEQIQANATKELISNCLQAMKLIRSLRAKKIEHSTDDPMCHYHRNLQLREQTVLKFLMSYQIPSSPHLSPHHFIENLFTAINQSHKDFQADNHPSKYILVFITRCNLLYARDDQTQPKDYQNLLDHIIDFLNNTDENFITTTGSNTHEKIEILLAYSKNVLPKAHHTASRPRSVSFHSETQHNAQTARTTKPSSHRRKLMIEQTQHNPHTTSTTNPPLHEHKCSSKQRRKNSTEAEEAPKTAQISPK